MLKGAPEGPAPPKSHLTNHALLADGQARYELSLGGRAASWDCRRCTCIVGRCDFSLSVGRGLDHCPQEFHRPYRELLKGGVLAYWDDWLRSHTVCTSVSYLVHALAELGNC